MLKRFLRNLRQKPKAARDNIALAAAGIFTAAVSSVWLYNFPSRVEPLVSQDDSAKETPGFTSFFGSMKEQLATLQESKPEEVAATSSELSTSSVDYIGSFSSSSMSGVSSTEPFSFIFSESTSSSASSTQIGITSTTTQVTPNTVPSAPRAIRIVTTSGSASTSASSTFTQ